MTTTKCELCGKEHNEESYFVAYRTTYIISGPPNGGHFGVGKGYGFYEPRLTEDELHILGQGEHNICVRRTDCINRQIANMQKSVKTLTIDNVERGDKIFKMSDEPHQVMGVYNGYITVAPIMKNGKPSQDWHKTFGVRSRQLRSWKRGSFFS